MKKIISAILSLVLAAALSGCEASKENDSSSGSESTSTDNSGSTGESVSSVTIDSDYVIKNLNLENAKIIENKPESEKWEKLTYTTPRINKQSADRIIKMAGAYGVNNISKDDLKMQIYDEQKWGKEFVPYSDYDKYPTDVGYEDFPFETVEFLCDDFYIEIQYTTGGRIELENRKIVNQALGGINTKVEGPWRPSFKSIEREKFTEYDENRTCVLNGKTVKIADALKYAEKYASENDVLFPKYFSAASVMEGTFTYENGNQSILFMLKFNYDGVPIEDLGIYSLKDENGKSYGVRSIHAECAMLTENTLDWIWFPAIDGTTEFTHEDCEIAISREDACQIVSKKLSQEYMFDVKEIQLMYVPTLIDAENGTYHLEPTWRFTFDKIDAADYGSNTLVYVSAVDGYFQMATRMG